MRTRSTTTPEPTGPAPGHAPASGDAPGHAPAPAPAPTEPAGRGGPSTAGAPSGPARPAGPAAPDTRASRHPGLVLACACLCSVLVVGLVAAVNLAVPLLAASPLHPGGSALLWIVDAYVVVFACLVIPGGAAGDRFGRKGALTAGLLVLAAGAVASALSASVPPLLAARALTGVGAALVLPNCVGVLVHATPPARRRAALATWGALTGAGGVVGNTGGAALLAGGSWQTLFVVAAAIAVVLAALVALAVPRSPRSARGLDPAGTALLVVATVALLFGIVDGPGRGWTSATVLGALGLAVLAGAAWIVVELRVRRPMLDPRLFRHRDLSGASLGMLVTFFGSFGLFYLNASLLQYGRGYGVLRAGFAILPLAVPLLVAPRLAPPLVARFGIPRTLATGFAAIGVGLLGLSTATDRPYVAYAAWLLVVGIGFALALPTLTAELAQALPPEQAGVAGGLQSATRELGSALGVAVVGTVLTAAFARGLPDAVRAAGAPRTVAQALAAAPARHAEIIDAFVRGGDVALRVAAVVTLLTGALVTAFAVPRTGHRGRA